MMRSPTQAPRSSVRWPVLTGALAAVLAAALLAGCGGGGGGGSPTPAPTLQPPLPQNYVATGRTAAGDVFVHLFEWRWNDIALECEQWLGPKGFKAVQISPPSEHAVITNAAGSGIGFPWWQRYQTVSYRLAQSRSGTQAEFADMIDRCKRAGVDIYADAVINHMTAGSGTGSAGSAYTKYDYPAVPWTSADFHAACGINNYGNAFEVQNCELVGLADLKTEETRVRNRIADYLIALHSLGVAGFRIDAAKHMHPRDLDAIVTRVNDAARAATPPRSLPYFFLEVINNPGEAVTAQDYFGVGFASSGGSDVTDFIYGYRVTDAFLGRGSATLQSLQSLTAQLLPADKSVVFVDNHDNQRGDNLRYADAGYRNAAIFLLAHPAGYPALMSSYGFDRSSAAGKDAGPPGAAGVTQSTFSGATSLCSATLGAPQVGAWICEHRVPAIAAMVAFRKAAAGAPLSDCGRAGGWEINADPNRIAFCRDGAGFVALSRSSVGGSVNLPTRLPPGSYCNVAVDQFTPAAGAVPASCSGAAIVVGPAPTGQALIPLPAGGAVALHVGAKLP